MKDPTFNRFVPKLRISHVCFRCGNKIKEGDPARYRVGPNKQYEYIHADSAECDVPFVRRREDYVTLPFNDRLEKIKDSSEIDILIPSIKSYSDLEPQISSIQKNSELPVRIIVTSIKASAAINRNFCLKAMANDIGIMLDDDMEGFFPGWDKKLIAPFAIDPDLVVISARLLDTKGKAAPNCADNYDMQTEYIYLPHKPDGIIPTACVAFKNLGVMFDDHYLGSGWEDSDWMESYIRRNSKVKFMINNNCKLIHRNEMKNQHGANWNVNMNYFRSKWKRKA